jgi:RNA ligase
MSSWQSYPSIFNLGHRAIRDLFSFPVVIQEKVDGSQFSFGVFDGEIKVRSKGREFPVDGPEDMFAAACATVRSLAPKLVDGWTYRGEYLSKPNHNTLAYDRVPAKHIILFDISTGDGEFLRYDALPINAEILGLEAVPSIYQGMVEDPDQLRSMLERVSVLGGQKIEGVCIKQLEPNLYGTDKKLLIGKFVSEAFKEVHREKWPVNNPAPSDVLEALSKELSTIPRWNKAIQHLREAGWLTSTPKDIGPLIQEIPADVLKEETEYIKEKLFAWAWPKIKRMITNGFPEFYKQKLLDEQFD